jgi:hypothetical protein
MVDFRYHVVSIIAVFLALATGILFGTTQLNGPILDKLRGDVREVSEEKDRLREQRDRLERALTADDEFVRTVAPQLVDGRLEGHRALIVTGPGVPDELADQVEQVLGAADATLAGRLRLQDRLFDPGSAAATSDLVARLVPAGVAIDQPTPAGRVGALVADVLTGSTTGLAQQPVPGAARVMAGLEDAGLVDLQGPVTRPADLVVVLLAGQPADLDEEQRAAAAAQHTAALDLVGSFSARAEAVLVGGPRDSSTVEGGPLRVLRADSARASAVASVDYADAPGGQVALVLALAEALGGEPGHYGTGPGADELVPELTARP